MKKFYILGVERKYVKEWFDDGSWSTDDTVTFVVLRENGKLIQVFGSGKASDYKLEEDDEIKLTGSQSYRHLGYGKIVEITTGLQKSIPCYVLK